MAGCALGIVSARRVLSETIVIVPGFRLCGVAAFYAALMLCLNLAASPAQAQSPAAMTPNAQSQMAQGEVSLEYFHERLALFGDWLNHPVWGEVWQPDAGPNFRPYFYGYWDYTSDYGSIWVSNEPYGDIVYHYGRWVFDLNYGWLWVPGYVWGPSWVVWRANQDYVGWLPMPPGYLDYGQPLLTAPYAGDSWYGYQAFYGPTFVSEYFYTLWVFVENKDFGRSERRRYVTDIPRLRDLYRDSRDRTHYVTERDRVHDGFIDREWLRREARRDVDPRPAASFLHRNVPVTSVSVGREIFRHSGAHNPDNATPLALRSGLGISAPQETAPRRSRAPTNTPSVIGGVDPAPSSQPVVPDSPGRSKFIRVPGNAGDANRNLANRNLVDPPPTPEATTPGATPPQVGGRSLPRYGIPRDGIGRARPGLNVGRLDNRPGNLPANVAPQGDSAAVPSPPAPVIPPMPPTATLGNTVPRVPGVFHAPGMPVARASVPGPAPSPVPIPNAVPPVAPAIVAPAPVITAPAPVVPAAPPAAVGARGGDNSRTAPHLRGLGGF